MDIEELREENRKLREWISWYEHKRKELLIELCKAKTINCDDNYLSERCAYCDGKLDEYASP